ncbi:hypothetical protein NL676_034029 [Syzygium grande]|nr:hypothetical protein NL676_034029 [Syzygium grande]
MKKKKAHARLRERVGYVRVQPLRRYVRNALPPCPRCLMPTALSPLLPELPWLPHQSPPTAAATQPRRRAVLVSSTTLLSRSPADDLLP